MIMSGSFLPSPWSSTNHSLLGSKEPALLCNHVAFGLLPAPYKLILQRGSFCGSDSTKSLRKVLKSSPWAHHFFFPVFLVCAGDLLPPVSNPTVTTSHHHFDPYST